MSSFLSEHYVQILWTPGRGCGPLSRVTGPASSDPLPRPEDDAALSIGDLAEATGIPVETLRMWERRYGRPASVRLPSGHRRYTAAQAVWLRSVGEALSRGARPSEILGAPPEALRSRLDAVVGDLAPAAAAAATGRLLDAARAFDGAAVRRLLRAAVRRAASPRAACEDALGPLLAAVGGAWAAGRIEVAHEHFVSEIVVEELLRLRAAAPPPRGAPAVVLAALPGETHVLGLEMAAVVAAHAGLRCVVLGADTPLADVATAARTSRARAVVVTVSLARGGIAADRALAELRALLPRDVRLFAGGGGLRIARRVRTGVETPGTLGALEEALRGLRRPGGGRP